MNKISANINKGPLQQLEGERDVSDYLGEISERGNSIYKSYMIEMHSKKKGSKMNQAFDAKKMKGILSSERTSNS